MRLVPAAMVSQANSLLKNIKVDIFELAQKILDHC